MMTKEYMNELRIRGALDPITDDIDDPFIPLQCWWVLERHCENDRGAVLELFRDGSFFRQPMVERHILERLMRRLAARGRQDDFIGCAGLLKNAPTQLHRDKLMAGFTQALEGQALPRLPDELIEQLRQLDNPPLVSDFAAISPKSSGQARARAWSTRAPSRPPTL